MKLNLIKLAYSYLLLYFRDIIQRVANIMKIYSFIHVAETIAVRSFPVQKHFFPLLSKTSLMCRQKTFICFFTFTGCVRKHCHGGREAEDWCAVQLGGILPHWVPDWSIFNVPCENGNFWLMSTIYFCSIYKR